MILLKDVLENFDEIAKWIMFTRTDYFELSKLRIERHKERVYEFLNKINYNLSSNYSREDYFYVFRYLFDACKTKISYDPLYKIGIMDEITIEDIISRIPNINKYWYDINNYNKPNISKAQKHQAYNLLVDLANIEFD